MCKVKILYSESVMLVNKNLSIGMLLDFYGQLLTDKQAEAIDFYYNQDFSLSEIAEELNISRQGVRDLIKRGEKQLLELEEALGSVKRFSDISADLAGIKACCNNISKKTQEKSVCEDIQKIIDIIHEITDEIQ